MNKEIIGIDLGGTNIRGGIVQDNHLSGLTQEQINARGTTEEVLQNFFRFIDKLISSSTTAIGVGVPGLVNKGTVYDVINIPSWQEIPLQKLMEERYQLPVAINNDANCFALGELYFGKGKRYDSLIGLTIGTGLGSGIIINKKLYAGSNCGAGEFGMMDYLDQCYEYYASGRFFENVYNINGETIFKKAGEGEKTAMQMYEEMGMHLGNAIKAVLYAMDIPVIILGGSVSKAFPYFSKTMWKQLQTFGFRKTIECLKIEVSELQNSGILGAADLCIDNDF